MWIITGVVELVGKSDCDGGAGGALWSQFPSRQLKAKDIRKKCPLASIVMLKPPKV